MKNKNIASLSGIITSELTSIELDGEEFTLFELTTSRLSKQVDKVRVICKHCDLDKLKHYKKCKTPVYLDGHITSYNMLKEDNSRTTFLCIRAFYIDKAKEVYTNIVELDGYIVSKMNYRHTLDGKTLIDLIVANNFYGKSAYIYCIAWVGVAKYVNRLDIGQKVSIKGRLQSRDYIKVLDDGSKVIKTAYELSLISLVKVD